MSQPQGSAFPQTRSAAVVMPREGKDGRQAPGGRGTHQVLAHLQLLKSPDPQHLFNSSVNLAWKLLGPIALMCWNMDRNLCTELLCVVLNVLQGRYVEREGGMLRIISGLYPRVPFVHISILSRIKYFLLKHFLLLTGSHSNYLFHHIPEARLQGKQVKTQQLECKALAEIESF